MSKYALIDSDTDRRYVRRDKKINSKEASISDVPIRPINIAIPYAKPDAGQVTSMIITRGVEARHG